MDAVLNVQAKKLSRSKFMGGDSVTEEDSKVYFSLL
jgi:glutathionyl-hydroquinone reductase